MLVEVGEGLSSLIIRLAWRFDPSTDDRWFSSVSSKRIFSSPSSARSTWSSMRASGCSSVRSNAPAASIPNDVRTCRLIAQRRISKPINVSTRKGRGYAAEKAGKLR
jgi:hypothetical protein